MCHCLAADGLALKTTACIHTARNHTERTQHSRGAPEAGQCSRAKSAHSNPRHRGCMGCRSPRCSNQCNTTGQVVLCRRAARRAAAGPPQLHIFVDTSCRAGFMPCGAGRDLEDPREMRFKTFTRTCTHRREHARLCFTRRAGSRANYVTYAVDAGFRIRGLASLIVRSMASQWLRNRLLAKATNTETSHTGRDIM